jgi:hypothetical protein
MNALKDDYFEILLEQESKEQNYFKEKYLNIKRRGYIHNVLQ